MPLAGIPCLPPNYFIFCCQCFRTNTVLNQTDPNFTDSHNSKDSSWIVKTVLEPTEVKKGTYHLRVKQITTKNLKTAPVLLRSYNSNCVFWTSKLQCSCRRPRNGAEDQSNCLWEPYRETSYKEEILGTRPWIIATGITLHLHRDSALTTTTSKQPLVTNRVTWKPQRRWSGEKGNQPSCTHRPKFVPFVIATHDHCYHSFLLRAEYFTNPSLVWRPYNHLCRLTCVLIFAHTGDQRPREKTNDLPTQWVHGEAQRWTCISWSVSMSTVPWVTRSLFPFSPQRKIMFLTMVAIWNLADRSRIGWGTGDSHHFLTCSLPTLFISAPVMCAQWVWQRDPQRQAATCPILFPSGWHSSHVGSPLKGLMHLFSSCCECSDAEE